MRWVLVLVSLVAAVANADTCHTVYSQWSDSAQGPFYGSAQAAATAHGAASNSSQYCPTGDCEQGDTATDQGNGNASVSYEWCQSGSCVPGTYTVHAYHSEQVCPTNPCSANAGKTVNFSSSSGPLPVGSTAKDGAGCTYTVKTDPVTVIGKCHNGTGTCAVQTATATGAQDGNQDNTPVGNQGDCFSNPSGNVCSEGGTQGKSCGTFNGDEVCVSAVPSGSCVSYASGGVACTVSSSGAVATPPAPDNGTAGQPAPPTGTVSSSTGGVVTTTNYYNTTTVTGSSGGVVTTPVAGGGNTGDGGSGTSTGSGGSSNGSGPSAPNGDCGAPNVTCGADGSVPQLSNVDTLQQSTSGYYSSLSAVPVVQAVASISAAVPAGECPTAQFAVYGTTYTIDEQCTLWPSVASIVRVCMLAVFTVLGVRVLMSA